MTIRNNAAKFASVFILSTSLGACASIFNSPNVAGESERLKTCAVIAGDSSQTSNAKESIIETANNAGESLDVLLACFLGPDPKGEVKNLTTFSGAEEERKSFYDHYKKSFKDVDVDEAEELRLLRGHAIVALLTRYAAFNATGEVGEINIPLPDLDPEDAMEILGSIHEAEYELRRSSQFFEADKKASTLNPPYLGPEGNFKNVEKAYLKLQRIRRVGAITELAKEAATPTGRRVLGFAKALAGVISTPTPDGVLGLFKRVKAGAEKLAILGKLGPAYIADTRDNLNKVSDRTVKKADWQELDELIEEGCGRLRKVAGVNRDCTPGNYK